MLMHRALPLMEADAGTSTGAAADTTVATSTAQTADTTDYKAMLEQKNTEYGKLKASFDKTSSELASLKKAEKERMTDEEKKAAEAAEKDAKFLEIQSELAAMKTQNVFAKAGYAEDDYKAVSEALVKACGEGASELAQAIIKFADGAKEKAVKSAQIGALKEGTVTPDGGAPKKESEDVSYARKLAKGNASGDEIAKIKKLYS